jgi:hypothetical protein
VSLKKREIGEQMREEWWFYSQAFQAITFNSVHRGQGAQAATTWFAETSGHHLKILDKTNNM